MAEEIIVPKNIAGYKTRINVSDISKTSDNSITITSAGDVSQTVKNNPEQYYPASVFGTAQGAFAALKEAGGTSIQTVVVDVSTEKTNGTPLPYITFETTALNESAPKITLYWTATSLTPDTIFATCSSKILTAPGSAFNWAPSTGTGEAVYNVEFEPGTNYTKAYLAGSFTDLGKSKPTNFKYNRYGTVNLTAGPPEIYIGSSGLSTNFGPLGSAISAVAADYAENFVKYYGGGWGGFSFNNTVTKILEVTISQDSSYICWGGSFTTVTFGTTTIACSGIFIADKFSPKEKFVRFQFPPVYTLEFEPQYESLIIGGAGTGRSAYILSGLSASPSQAASRSWQTGVDTASASKVSKISRLFFKQGNPLDPLWKRIQIDKVFTENVANELEAETRSKFVTKLVQYNNNSNKIVVFAGGNHRSNKDSPQVGFTAHYCGGKGESGSGLLVHSVGVPNSVQNIWSPNVSFEGIQTYSINVTDIKIDQTTEGGIDRTIMYICGGFNNPQDENKIKDPTCPYIIAYDLGLATGQVGNVTVNYLNNGLSYPERLLSWKPKPNKFVASMSIDPDLDDGVIYAIGGFTTLVAGGKTYNRSGLVALNKANVENLGSASVYDWNLAISPLPVPSSGDRDKIYTIPETSPLSGLIIHTSNMTKINAKPVNRIARVVKYKQTIAPFQERAVVWQLGCKLLDGSDLLIDPFFVAASSAALPENEVVRTFFEVEDVSGFDAFQNSNKGNFLRFLITPKAAPDINLSNYYYGRTWVIGAKVDHNG